MIVDLRRTRNKANTTPILGDEAQVVEDNIFFYEIQSLFKK